MSVPNEITARFLNTLHGVRRSGAGWMARCPAHEDRQASLSVAAGDDGRALVHCHAGCSIGAVTGAVGLTPAELCEPREAREPRRREIVATYDYTDADGKLAYQVVRYAPKDFRQRRPDGTGWSWSLAGVERVPYRLPELVAAPADATVYIVEGEKDADRLAALGLVATCNAGGAGKWHPSFAAHLAGRSVVILPDNDNPGRHHAEQVREALAPFAQVRILELPELPDKGDVSDWLAAGGTVEALQALALDAQPAPTAGLRFYTPAEIAASTTAEPQWIIHGYTGLEILTEVDGKVKRSGKTTLTLDAIAAILNRTPWLGQPTSYTKVIYITEQQRGPFLAALTRAGLHDRGDELLVLFRHDFGAMPWPEVVAAVADKARDIGALLVVIDTIAKLAAVKEENSASDWTTALEPLQRIAHDGLAVWLCRHSRKGDAEIGESGRGSSAASGDVDIILDLRRPTGNQPATRRVLESMGRYSEYTPEKVVIDLTPEGYVLLGDDEAVSHADAERILSALLGGDFGQKESWTLDELVAESDEVPVGPIARSTAQRVLRSMRERHLVTEFTDDGGKARKGHPLRYAARHSVSAHSIYLEGQNESEDAA